MTEAEKSKFWLDLAVEEIIKQHPEGEILVESGISPSGAYHVGNFREIITTDAVRVALQQRGRQARHVHFVDDSDPLRKLYPFLPKDFEQWIGYPYWKIPDPAGDCHKTYAQHYFEEFESKMGEVGVEFEARISHEEYIKGTLNRQLELAISKADRVRQILQEVSGRELANNWTGVQVLEGKTFRNITADEWADAKKLIPEGRVKLSWRLDWPARWAALGVNVEPFGREHATKGGSYDTGARIVNEVFEAEPPFPIAYDTINLAGQTKKMSSSIGNLVSLADALEIMPAEILRFFVVRSRPERQIFFDPGVGIFNLIEEYSKVKQAAESKQSTDFLEAYKFASAGSDTKQTISGIPFSHLVASYQAALGEKARVYEILERTGFSEAVQAERKVLDRELIYVKNWLEKYAPAEVKFEIQQQLPKIKLSQAQQDFLKDLAVKLDNMQELEAQGIHEAVYELKDEHNLEPAGAFQAIYRVILNKDYGPKAGWFLACLDHNWLIKRLKLEA